MKIPHALSPRLLPPALVLTVLGLLASPPLHARCQDALVPTPTFTRIADTNTAVPDGSGTFGTFYDARAIEGGKVAFIAFGSGSGEGIYTFENGVLNGLANSSTGVPGTADTFTNFFDVSIDGSVVAFTGGWPGPGGGCSFSGSEGVFVVPFGGGTPTTVGTSLTSSNNCFHGVDYERGVIGVAGGVNPVDVFHNHTEAILATKTLANPQVFFDTSTPNPSGGTFVGYDQDFRIRGRGILLAEIIPNTIGAVAGLYTDHHDGQGPQLVADAATAIPGGSGNFMNFASADWDGQTVAFMGRNAGNAGALFRGTSPANLQRLVDNTTPVPGAGVNFLGVSNPIAYDNGVLVFSGYWSGGNTGLFAWRNGAVISVLKKGDALDGGVIDQAFTRTGGLSGRDLLIKVSFQGGSRTGLYLVRY